jgi:hypothetical protein
MYIYYNGAWLLRPPPPLLHKCLLHLCLLLLRSCFLATLRAFYFPFEGDMEIRMLNLSIYRMTLQELLLKGTIQLLSLQEQLAPFWT